MFGSQVLQPPFTVRQEADRIFINDVQVYPPTEVEMPSEEAVAGSEDVFGERQDAYASRRMSEVESKIAEFYSAKAENWGNFKAASFEAQADEIKTYLERQGLPTERSSKYGDVLVPITEDFGRIALFNEAARIQVCREADVRYQPERVYEYDSAQELAEYIEANLNMGSFLKFSNSNNVIEAIPRDLVNEAAEQLREESFEGKSFDELTYEQKVSGLADKVASLAGTACTAVIFFPHRSWQKEAVGKASTYWLTLAFKLLAEKYKVYVYLDKSVTLNTWATFLANGKDMGLSVIYNEGHGDDDLIQVGEPNLKGGWYYFRSGFVKKYGNLKGTLVYIHSCATMSDLQMAGAFVAKGACAYLGWQHPTSANPDYCDKVDSLFWSAMIDLNSTAVYARQQVGTIDTDFRGHGNPQCRLPVCK
jgi:hypothetical protein